MMKFELPPDVLALDAAKKKALEDSMRADRERFGAQQRQNERTAYRQLNRAERRKLAAEIAKAERGDHT